MFHFLRKKKINIIKNYSDVKNSRNPIRLSLCDLSKDMVKAWYTQFENEGAVEIIQDDILKLKCDALVS